MIDMWATWMLIAETDDCPQVKLVRVTPDEVKVVPPLEDVKEFDEEAFFPRKKKPKPRNKPTRIPPLSWK